MRDPVRAFLKLMSTRLPWQGPVQDFGGPSAGPQVSLPLAREFFPGASYIRFAPPKAWPGDPREYWNTLHLPSGSAGTVLCLDCLGQVFEVQEAWDELLRVLAPGGVLVVSLPLSSPGVAAPDDYWRLTPNCLMRLMQPLAARVVGWLGPTEFPHTVLGVGFKAPLPAELPHAVGAFLHEAQTWAAQGVWNADGPGGLFRPGWSWLPWKRRDDRQVNFVFDLPAGRLPQPKAPLVPPSPPFPGKRFSA